MIIQNGLVYDADGHFKKRDLYTDGAHKITDKEHADTSEIIDATGLYVVPGFVDVHIHGAVGNDFCDADSKKLTQIAAYLKSQGVTSFCPTSMTLPEEQLSSIFASIKNVPKDSSLAKIAGINMEGPFISPDKRGAQKESYIRNPDIDMFERLYSACDGVIRLVTLAPELPCSMDFIEKYHDTVSISLGHTSTDYETAMQAFSGGANHVTHLFNAMPPLHHRNPGLIGAAADSPDVMVEIICDGIHLHPSVIRSVFQCFGAERVILISDAMRAAGMEDGNYELGGQPVVKHGKYATLHDGTLAGSVTNLYQGLRNAVSYGIPLEAALRAATLNPAASIHQNHTIGTLAAGADADILLLNKKLDIVKIF